MPWSKLESNNKFAGGSKLRLQTGTSDQAPAQEMIEE